MAVVIFVKLWGIDVEGKDQALYFQKMTATTAFAAGIADVQGIEGLPVSQLTGLSWYIRDPQYQDHCGAGAPRWDVRGRTSSGASQTFLLGCAAMTPGLTQTAPNSTTYTQRTASVSAIQAIPGAVITGLSIVFDEGDDVGSGFAHLDNIEVDVNGTPHIWTSATDNGGSQ